MEETILKDLQPVLSKLLALSKREKSMWFDYDEEADVLYVSFRKPQQATDTEMVDDDILLRKRNGNLVGVTIMHASRLQ